MHDEVNLGKFTAIIDYLMMFKMNMELKTTILSAVLERNEYKNWKRK